MGAAAAEIACQRPLDLVLARPLVPVEQGLGMQDHAVDAIAALHRLILDERFLQGIRIGRGAEALERSDSAFSRVADRKRARTYRLAVDMHGAGTALAKAAAEARAMQSEIVAQGVQKRHLRVVHLDGGDLAVHVERDFTGHGFPSYNCCSTTLFLPGGHINEFWCNNFANATREWVRRSVHAD